MDASGEAISSLAATASRLSSSVSANVLSGRDETASSSAASSSFEIIGASGVSTGASEKTVSATSDRVSMGGSSAGSSAAPPSPATSSVISPNGPGSASLPLASSVLASS